MKVEQLPSGTFRIRLMIDGHRYTFTDKDKKRVKAMASQFADEHREVLIYVYRHTISDETAALTDRALNHFDSVTKFVTN